MRNLVALFISLFLSDIQAQENITYQKPPQEIVDLVDFDRAPSVLKDSKNEMIVFAYRDTYKTLEDLSQDEVRLGGLRINPVANISSQMTYITNLKVRAFKAKDLNQVTGLPENPRIAYVSWSPNETKIAFTHTTNTGVELWYIDVASASAKKITTDNLNANLGSPYNWMKDNQTLLVKVLPKNRQSFINEKKEFPKGPTESVSYGSKSQNRN
jgi:hypothetical protein